jgi:hypothetical protein
MPIWRPPRWRDTGPTCGAIIVITIITITGTTAIIGTTGVTIITIGIITTTIITIGTTGAITTTTVIIAEPIRNMPAARRAAGIPRSPSSRPTVRRRRA